MPAGHLITAEGMFGLLGLAVIVLPEGETTRSISSISIIPIIVISLVYGAVIFLRPSSAPVYPWGGQFLQGSAWIPGDIKCRTRLPVSLQHANMVVLWTQLMKTFGGRSTSWLMRTGIGVCGSFGQTTIRPICRTCCARSITSGGTVTGRPSARQDSCTNG